MSPKKAEICPRTGNECNCRGPITFESRNPAALAVRERVSMCASPESITDDDYVMDIREELIEIHQRVLRHTRRLPYIEEIWRQG